MGDTGATLCAINAQYARKYFSEEIKTLKTSLKATTANGTIPLKEYIDISMKTPNKGKITLEFYLIPELGVKFLASLYLIKQLGWSFVRSHKPHQHFNERKNKRQKPQINKSPKSKSYHHKTEDDETFGSCNNWEKETINNNYNNKMAYTIKQDDTMRTPYEEYIHICNSPQPIGIKFDSVNFIQIADKIIKIPKKSINHISNFVASAEEIAKAKKLTKDELFPPIDISYLKKQLSHKGYKRMLYLCHNKYKNAWAKHQFHTRPIPGKIFHLNLKEEAYHTRIYKEQYHLNEEKRLVVLYNAIKNQENKVYQRIQHSIHNVPVIVIKRKDGRQRLAYDLQKLNSFTKDIQSHIPPYPYYFGIFAQKGKSTQLDFKNFFENFILHEPDRKFVAITTPLGRFVLTRATYGFKNIATFAQQVSEEIIATFNNAAAFIDDVFIKHPPNATETELIDTVERILDRTTKKGVLLHPGKTVFFADKIAFIGYMFTQKGHHPLPQYLNKILKIKKPKTIKEIQAYLGLIQYIARYLHKYSEWSHELTVLTRKDNKTKWGEVHDEAFNKLQEQIKNIKMLYHPTANDPFLVQCDASKYALGAVLYQYQKSQETGEKQWKIIEFYSKQIDPHMIKHPIMVKECMAIAFSLNHWKHFLLRKKFYLDTDHKNLISLYDDDETKAPEMRKKQIFQTLRQATAMFHFELAHLEGANLILADYLSRDGSVLNSIDNNINLDKQITGYEEYKQKIRLIRKRYDDQFHKIQIIKAMTSHQQLRLQIFQDIKQQTNHAYNHINYINNKKSLDTAFTLNDLDKEYIKNHGYIQNLKKVTFKNKVVSATNTISTNLRNDTIIDNHVHVPSKKLPRQDSHPKSILRNKNDNTYVTTTKLVNQHSRHSKRLNNQKKLNVSLGLALANTIRNTTRVTAKDIGKYQLLLGLYTMHDGSKLESFDEQTARNINILDKEIPNYNTDSLLRRRSTRKRKQVKHYWDQEVFTKGTAYPNLYDSETSDEDDSHIVGNNDELDRVFKQNEIVPTNPTGSIVNFPFKINQNIIESFRDRLHLPEKYAEILSPESLKHYQQIDPIIVHIQRVIPVVQKYANQQTKEKIAKSKQIYRGSKTSQKESLKYLEDYCRSTYRALINNQFYQQDGILMQRSQDHKGNKYQRFVIPSKLIHTILEYEHVINTINHPGAQVMIRMMHAKYFWPFMKYDIIEYVRQCQTCQLGKGGKKHKIGRLAPSKVTHYGHTVHCDYAGPFWNTVSILVMICATTGAVALVLCYAQTAENIANALVHHWIPYHGIPVKVVTDRGSGFKSKANKAIYKLLGIHGVLTSSYHPQTNAKAERVVQEVKKALRMINIDLQDHFTDNEKIKDKQYVKQLIQELYSILPSIQFAINQRIHTITQTSPNMLIYGRNLRDKIDVKLAKKLLNDIHSQLDNKSHFEVVKQLRALIQLKMERFKNEHKRYRLIQKRDFNFGKSNDNFKIGDIVAYYVGDRSSTTKSIRRRFTGPWQIIGRLRHNTVKIKNPHNNETLACHTSMLKSYREADFTPYIEHRIKESMQNPNKQNKKIAKNYSKRKRRKIRNKIRQQMARAGNKQQQRE